MDICQTNEDRDEDKSEFENQFQKLQKFYQELASNLLIYDPLDRDIPNSEDNEAIRRKDLLDKLIEMPSIEASTLLAPMSIYHSFQLSNMQLSMQNQCNTALMDIIKNAKLGSSDPD